MFGLPKLSQREKTIDRMASIAPVGSQIEYLGRTLTVMQHSRRSDYGPVPLMTCQYVDDHGVIREHSFGSDDLDTLEAVARPLGGDDEKSGGWHDVGPADGLRSASEAVTGYGQGDTAAESLRFENNKRRGPWFRYIRPRKFESVRTLIIDAEWEIQTECDSDVRCRLSMTELAYDRLKAEMQAKNGGQVLGSNQFFGMNITIIHDPADASAQVLVMAEPGLGADQMSAGQVTESDVRQALNRQRAKDLQR